MKVSPSNKHGQMKLQLVPESLEFSDRVHAKEPTHELKTYP